MLGRLNYRNEDFLIKFVTYGDHDKENTEYLKYFNPSLPKGKEINIT